MTIADLSDLPKTKPAPEGLAPDPEPRFGLVIAEREASRGEKPHAFDTPFRYSSAAGCARALSYKATGVEPEPFDLTTFQTFRIGTLVHEDWQAAMADAWGDDIAFEVPTGCGWDGEKAVPAPNGEALTSGHCDAVWTTDVPAVGEFSTVIELKTSGGWGYKQAVGYRGKAEGPKPDHIVQLALNVVGNDADEGVLIYMAKDMVAKGSRMCDDGDPLRFVAEWTFTRAELQVEADRELRRLAEIKRLVDAGELAPRHIPYEMPAGARIIDVSNAAWTLTDDDGNVVDNGDVWGGRRCGYCELRKHCEGDLERGV